MHRDGEWIDSPHQSQSSFGLSHVTKSQTAFKETATNAIMISFQAILSVFLLAAIPAQVFGQEQRSMRILLNNGGKLCTTLHSM